MQHHSPEQILSKLEERIRSTPLTPVDPMLGDVWLLASALQKTIRRGETDRALSAATALWHQDKDRFWRRLAVICPEDIGVSATETLIEAFTAISASRWRRQIGDLQVGLALVAALSTSVKTRIADELFSQAERGSRFDGLRQAMAAMSDDSLVDFVLSEGPGLVEKALGLWYLSGTTRYPSDVIPPRKGSPEASVEVLRLLNTPSDLTEGCISVMGRSAYPLAIWTPLIWLETERRIQQPQIRLNTIELSGEVKGIPYYAADMFTRVGQSSIRKLQKEVPELRGFSVKQVGLAIFYLEGCQIDRTWNSKWADDFCRAGELADIEGAGLGLPEYMGLRDSLSQNWERLTSLRHDQIRSSLEGA